MTNKNEGYVFGLDIGTRSIVGTVGYRMGADRFVVIAQESKFNYVIIFDKIFLIIN